MNFWATLPSGFVGLAPMDGVTDQPFRHIVAKYGQPDVIFTEFTHVAGLCHGASIMLRQLLYDESQRPIVAQIFGTNPEYFRQVALLVAALGFDGVDLNMGCPSSNVVGGGAGAGLIKTPELAQKIIRAAKQGIQDWAEGKTCLDCPDLSSEICEYVTNWQTRLPPTTRQRLENHQPIPVSVKTRTGYSQPEIETWIPALLEVKPAALTLHGRTLKQGYKGRADWELIAQAARLARQAEVVIIGNGDVANRQQAEQKAAEFGVDGVLIGRAAQGNPFVFNREEDLTSSLPASSSATSLTTSPTTAPINTQNTQAVSLQASSQDFFQENKKRIEIALEHARYYQDYFQAWVDQEASPSKTKYSFFPMRKHLAWYIKGVKGAASLRSKLVRTNSANEVEQILKSYLANLQHSC
ncbi:MAG: hypothetical protein GF381_01015 [Candidatus Pacebacteria bacterium]|nr:hypothetical protein [Candidatus Paceibacterota bacterium]